MVLFSLPCLFDSIVLFTQMCLSFLFTWLFVIGRHCFGLKLEFVSVFGKFSAVWSK